jgi:DNA invertase Pin-like site-specific DNA recombinase
VVVGYARTSTLEQVAGFEAQIRELAAAGAERTFQEQVSSVGARAQLDAALDFVRDGDTLVVTKLDRLARSVAHLLAISEHLRAKGVALRILNLGIDTETPTGRLMFQLLGSIAEFERALMHERKTTGRHRRGQSGGKIQGQGADRPREVRGCPQDGLRRLRSGRDWAPARDPSGVRLSRPGGRGVAQVELHGRRRAVLRDRLSCFLGSIGLP